MSIFSKIKVAKKAAKDHKQAQQGAAPETVDKPVPYKHIPTHAAIDAMAGAPASYKEADRIEIKATNEKRRSMLAQSAQSSSGVSSPLHRNSSYGSTSNYSYSRPMPSRVEARRSYGANGGYYNNGLQVGHQPFSPSPLASKGPSPTGSLNESSSSSSSHLVEMQYAAPVSHAVPFPQTAPTPTSYGTASAYAPPAPKRFEQTMMETIHSSPTRKLGEAPVLSQPPATLNKPAVAPVPVQAKKRSWGFGKRNSHGTAIAAH